jgi:outer membrane protein
MQRVQTVVSILCVRLLIAPAFAQPAHQIGAPGGTFSWLTGQYRMRPVAPINLANSGRLELLLRAGRLYLSMQDSIALALENNLDIEIQRYGPEIADTQVLRARAGGFAQGVSTSVTAGPTSAQSGGVAQSGVSGNPSTQASCSQRHSGGQHRDHAIRTADSQLSTRPIVGSASWAHQSIPESSTFIAGVDELIQRQDTLGLHLPARLPERNFGESGAEQLHVYRQ